MLYRLGAAIVRGAVEEPFRFVALAPAEEDGGEAKEAIDVCGGGGEGSAEPGFGGDFVSTGGVRLGGLRGTFGGSGDELREEGAHLRFGL